MKKLTVFTCVLALCLGMFASVGAFADDEPEEVPVLVAPIVGAPVIGGGMDLIAPAPAEDTETESEPIEIEMPENPDTVAKVTVENKIFTKTYKGSNGQKISVDIEYPVVTIEGNEKATKAANKAIKKAFVTPYKYSTNDKIVAEFGEEKTKATVYGIFNYYQRGNILSIEMGISTEIDHAAHPLNKTVCLNINLLTGKKATMTTLFKYTSKLRSKAAASMMTQLEDFFAENGAERILEDEMFSTSIAELLEKGWNLDNCIFDENGMQVIFDEYAHGQHAIGDVVLRIDNKLLSKYLKKAGKSILNPNTLITVEFPSKSAGTGYSWFGGPETEGILEEVYETYVYAAADGITGGPGRTVKVFKIVGKGEVTLHYDYYRSWEGEDSSVDCFKQTYVFK